jgi:hypothetical protein
VQDAPPSGIEPRPIARWAVTLIAGAALATLALIAFSLTRPEPLGYALTDSAEPFPGTDDGSLRLTIDASSPDHWRYISLVRGGAVGPRDPWDIAFRRFHIMANGGPGFAGSAAIADLGAVPLDDATSVPADAAFRTTDAARDSTNSAIARWYRYGFTSHLLTPLDRTYVVRSTAGRHYALRVAGYYCPGARPGCVTIRYLALDPADP